MEKSIHFQIEKTNRHVSVNLQNKPCKPVLLAQLTDFVLTGMDKQMHTGMILVDLQKAFDFFQETSKFHG